MDRSTDKKSAAETYDERLKGTFISVLSIGAFIVLSWLAIFYYYINTL